MPELRVVFLDAGQGDCTLVVFPNGELMLVDCGCIWNKDVVTPEIVTGIKRYLGRGGIHRVVITHPDEDHYNRLTTVMSELGNPRIGEVWFGGGLELYRNENEHDAAYDWLTANNAKGFGPSHFGARAPTILGRQGSNTEAKLYVLAANSTGNPDLAAPKSKNENSVVMLVEYNGYKVFLMGDAFASTEGFIMNRATQPPDVSEVLRRSPDSATSLKMGHHGSKTSSSQQWVEMLEPAAFFLSADTKPFGNSGMPSGDFVKEVVTWSTRVYEGLVDHGVVVYKYKDQMWDVWTTKTTIYSTLTALKFVNQGFEFEAKGGSWHLTVNWNGTVAISST